MQFFLRALRNGSSALIIAGLMSMGVIASANSNKPASAPRPAPASRPAPAARPSGGNRGGARPGSAPGGGSRFTTNGGGARFNTNGGGSHPAVNGGGSHPNTQLKIAGAPKGSNAQVTKSGSMVRTHANGKPSDVHDAKTWHECSQRAERKPEGLGGASRSQPHCSARGAVRDTCNIHIATTATISPGAPTITTAMPTATTIMATGYRGMYLNVYAPGLYYSPCFYGWAYNPWAMPIAFGWGWGGSPWFGYYGYYFAPYPIVSFGLVLADGLHDLVRICRRTMRRTRKPAKWTALRPPRVVHRSSRPT